MTAKTLKNNTIPMT